jgi:hypothetical protein
VRYRKKHKRGKGKFRSKLEEIVASKIPKGVSWKFESEKLPYLLPKTYIPDIIIDKPDGRKLFIEIKGYLRDEDQRKMRAVKHTNPQLDIRFYFPNDGKVHRSQMTNSEWCRKYDFPYCIGKIPKSWYR